MASVFSGALLRAKIESLDVRYEDVAAVSGLSWITVSRLCKGTARPSTKSIELLAEVLGCEPGEFFADDGKSRALPPPDGKLPPPLSAETREKLRALLDLSGREREHGAA
jgi:transcriptional regulator with XRE-family HTH domain